MAIVNTLALVVGTIAVLKGLSIAALELNHRQRRKQQLELTPGTWQLDSSDRHRYRLVGELEFRNRSSVLDIAVPEVAADVTLISKGSLDDIGWRVKVLSAPEGEPPRPDGYWLADIIGSQENLGFKVAIEIWGEDLSQLQTAWVKVRYTIHGIDGECPHTRHAIVPLREPEPKTLPWQSKPGAQVLPVKTHLLTHADDPVEVVKRYVTPHAQPGDIVTLGETPLAIMQDRIRHPETVRPGWLAKRLCHLFGQRANLATASSLQVLIDLVGPVRVGWAFVFGAIAKVLGKSGVFYQLAGEQARLIDDVSGTIPPYDRFILLGPDNPNAVVDRIYRETGIQAAIVDVNDLQAVKILAATSGISHPALETSLRSNPAGNADEQTPLVLVRPA